MQLTKVQKQRLCVALVSLLIDEKGEGMVIYLERKDRSKQLSVRLYKWKHRFMWNCGTVEDVP